MYRFSNVVKSSQVSKPNLCSRVCERIWHQEVFQATYYKCLLSKNLCCRVLPITGCFLCSRRTPEFPLLLFPFGATFEITCCANDNINFYCLHSSVEYKCPSVRSETFACGMCEQNVLVRRVPVLPYMWPAVNKQVVQGVQAVNKQAVQSVQAVQGVHNKTISPNQRYHFQCKLEHSPFSYIWLLERSFWLFSRM